MATPHINAPDGAFADVVLMPERSAGQIYRRDLSGQCPSGHTDVRGMLGFTGSYRGRPVRVMELHGMGILLLHLYQGAHHRIRGERASYGWAPVARCTR